MDQPLTFSLNYLADKTPGTRESYTFSEEVELDGLTLKSPISGEVEIMKLDDTFHVTAKNIQVTVELLSAQSGRPHQVEITIPSAERHFYIDSPKKVDDPCDLFVIDKKNLKLNIGELLRQEIILHFPSNPVCLASAEAVCPQCGFDLTALESAQSQDEITKNQPLKGLKDLLK